MENKEIEKIITKTIDSTSAGTINWNETTGDDEYQVDFARSSLLVFAMHADNHGFIIYNSNGKIICRAFDSDLEQELGYRPIQKLYAIVEKSILRYDDTISDVLEGLEGNSVREVDEPPF